MVQKHFYGPINILQTQVLFLIEITAQYKH